MTEGMKIISICRICNKKFWRRSRGERPYCSRECAAKGRRTGRIVKCENCGKEVYKCKIHLKNHDYHCCSIECWNEFQSRNKISFICKMCGKKFEWSPSRIKDSNPTYCSIECRDKDPEVKKRLIEMNEKQRKKIGLNKIEVMGSKILDNIGLKYKEQILIGNKFLVDIFVPEYNLIIQWDGDYWHCHPRFTNPDHKQLKRKKIDKSQNEYFKSCGYVVLRFWGSDIIKKPEWIENKIRVDIKKIKE